MATDYPLVGPPTIDLRTFQAVLAAAHSPATGEAPAIYATALSYHVDPAVLLAIMQHESGFGTAGIAVGRHNLFGSRYYAGTAQFGAVNRGGWASFPSYTASAAYTASLLASSSYAGAGYTARTFPERYAPSSDGNNPAAYGLAIVNAINAWRGAPKAPASSKPGSRPAAKAPTRVGPTSSAKVSTPVVLGIGIVGVAVVLLILLR